MSSAYLVCIGEYSDSRVIAAFSTREAAEVCVASIAHLEKARIDQVPLDPDLAALPGAPARYQAFEVDMLRDGTVQDLEREPYKLGAVAALFAPKVNVHPDSIVVILWARSDEHAIKVANEIRARVAAEGWVVNKPW